MRSCDDKPRDMARSILPSRWRGARAARASLHRAARRGVHASLRELARDPAAWDDGVAFDEWLSPEVSGLVWRRRASDKLNHFERWAVAATRKLPVAQRLGAMRAVLPRGLIGTHALSHLERRAEFEAGLPRPPWRRVCALLDRGEVAELLRAVVKAPAGLRCFNEALRRAERTDGTRQRFAPGARRLLGLHDVLPFVAWLQRPAARVDRFVVDDFCRAFKASRGDAEAALAASVASRSLPVLDFHYRR